MYSSYKFTLLITILSFTNYTIGSSFPCQSKTLALYSLTLRTFWNENDFPKQYPLFRPPAQWSKLFGITHNSNTVLWRNGELARPGISEMAEIGISNILEAEINNETIIAFNEFKGASITSGQGVTSSKCFADGNNTRVSLIMKIIPSPDWFIGLDSFDLCKEGNWIDSAEIQIELMDAGTDDGFTFTSPNWKSDPQHKITRITNKFPNHPVNSFYYPELEKLPDIGKIIIKREKVFKMLTEEANEIPTLPLVVKRVDDNNNNNNQSKAYFVRSLKRKHAKHMITSRNKLENNQNKGTLINCALQRWKKTSMCKVCKFRPSQRRRKVIVLSKSRRKLFCPKMIQNNIVTLENTIKRKSEKNKGN